MVDVDVDLEKVFVRGPKWVSLSSKDESARCDRPEHLEGRRVEVREDCGALGFTYSWSASTTCCSWRRYGGFGPVEEKMRATVWLVFKYSLTNGKRCDGFGDDVGNEFGRSESWSRLEGRSVGGVSQLSH